MYRKLAALVLAAAAAYLLFEVNFSNARLFHYAMKIRTPKLLVMLITAFATGGASIVFQHIITQKDGTDAGAEAKAYLEDNGLKQTATVECMGDPVLISGNAVMLRDNATGTVGLFWIDSDTHTWKNGQYFCRLSLNFGNIMHNVNAGQEVSR